MIRLDTLKITPSVLRTITEIDYFSGYWSGLDDHTKGLNLIGDVAKHGKSFNALLEPLRHKELSVDIVMALHAALSQSSDKGCFKTDDSRLLFEKNHLPLGEIDTASPEDAPILLEKLLAWVNHNLSEKEHHPLLALSIFSAIFLQISPFSSDNRRIVCFLLVLLMLKAGYRYAPYASLEGVMHDESVGIYESLLANQRSVEAGLPDWSAWQDCFFACIVAHKDILQAKLSGDDHISQITDMPDLSIAMLDVLKTHQRVTMKQLISETGGRRSTIKLRLQELVDDKLITRHGAGRGVWYSLS